MSPDEAVNYGLSGPMLRASGVAYDVRKDFPYLDYETYDFDVPGRHERRRLRPLSSCAWRRCGSRCASSSRRSKRLPDGPVNVDDPRVILPPKSQGDERDGDR